MSGTADLVPSVPVLTRSALACSGHQRDAGKSRKEPPHKTALHQLFLAIRALISESELQVM